MVRSPGMLSTASPTPPNARRYPLSYVLSGLYRWGNGGLDDQGSSGYWWSSAAGSDSSAYNLGMNSSDLNPQGNYSKVNGFTLRSTIARRYPLSYVLSGYYIWSDGYLNRQDSYGFWWATTANDTNNGAYSLDVGGSTLNPQNSNGKVNGFTLRCETWRRGNPVLLSSPGSCGVNTLDILMPTI